MWKIRVSGAVLLLAVLALPYFLMPEPWPEILLVLYSGTAWVFAVFFSCCMLFGSDVFN